MRIHLAFIFCVAIFFASCSSELEQVTNNLSQNQLQKVETGIMRNIKNYIHNFGNNGNPSRNANDYTLSPFIYNGDTVMYIINYRNGGWKLMSTDHRVPMVIMDSDTGNFDSNAIKKSPAFANYVDNVAEELWQVKNSEEKNGSTYGLWNLVSIQNNEVDLQNIEVAPKARGSQPGTDGYWVLLETTTPVKEVATTDKLTSTKWGQTSPWNIRIPYAIDDLSVIGPIGCEGVAVGQYLYYLHTKDGIPASTVTHATYDAKKNVYIYSGSSNDVWNEMAVTSSGNSSSKEKTAIFLGYVSQQIGTEYYSKRGSAKFKDAINFINAQSGKNYYVSVIDYEYVNNELGKGRAVYTRAETSSGEGHAFIIDRKRVTYTTSTSTYGWVGKDNTGQDTNDYDDEGNIIGYSFFYEKENRIESTDYFMNWGWNGSYDNVACTASSGSDWNVGYSLNVNRKIAKE